MLYRSRLKLKIEVCTELSPVNNQMQIFPLSLEVNSIAEGT